MKFFIALSAVIFVTSALPTKIGNDASIYAETAVLNTFGQTGYATLNNGTYGGIDGAHWTVWDAWALRAAVSGDEPRIIEVRGTIDLTPLFTGSPGVILDVGKYKTIIGFGEADSVIYGGGLKISEGSQVVIRNIKFHNALSYAPGEKPNGAGGIANQISGSWSQVVAIDIESTSNVWIDHCEFADDPWVAAEVPAMASRHDGLIDIKRGSNFISISYNIFRNHNLVSLIGHNDANGWQDINSLKVTFYSNWFMGTLKRNPRVRFGEVHMLNNLYTDIREYAIGAGTGAKVYVERNVFVNTTRAWGYPSVIPNPPSFVIPIDNKLRNSAHDDDIPDASNYNPANSYWYTSLNVDNVESHVRTHAGTWN